MRELKFRLYGDGKMFEPFTLDNDFDCVTGWMTDRVIMQYTGLKDKNGKEIYEGDVLRADNWNPKVFRTEKIIAPVGFSLGYFNLQTRAGLHLLYDTSGIEVIGNIYENPELIKDTAQTG